MAPHTRDTEAVWSHIGPAPSAANSASEIWPFSYLGPRPKTGPLLPDQLPTDRMEFPQGPQSTLSKGALILGDLQMEAVLSLCH